MIRLKTFTIEEVEDLLKQTVLSNLNVRKIPKHKRGINRPLEITIGGEKIYALSDRYKLFFTKGYTCCRCGLTGSFWALEKHVEQEMRYHLNLYAIDNSGREVLMNKDHIIPKSLGGKDCMSNYQTMCVICNGNKGNKI